MASLISDKDPSASPDRSRDFASSKTSGALGWVDAEVEGLEEVVGPVALSGGEFESHPAAREQMNITTSQPKRTLTDVIDEREDNNVAPRH